MKNVEDESGLTERNDNMKSIWKKESAMKYILRMAAAFAGCAVAVCLMTGCGISRDGKYAEEERHDLAKLEIYEAGSDTPLKTVEDEETLYQCNQILSRSGDDGDGFAECEPEFDDYEPEEGEWKENPSDGQETYRIVVYKYPVAKFGDKEPVKTLTMTLYENTDIVRIVVADTVIKSFSLPEEFLTFYYEMTEEEREFYASLTEG